MSQFENTPAEQTGYGADMGGQPQGAGGGAPDGGGGGDYSLGALGGELGDDYAIDPLAAADGPKKKHTGAMVLILTVGLAIGSLFSMHTLTKVTAASGKNTEIERTIEQFLKNMGTESPDNPDGAGDLVDGHNEVVKALTDNYVEHQVKQLDRNPFSLFGGATSQGPGPGARIDQVERAFRMLRLKSVIGGRRPLANINGRIVRLNQIVPIELSKAEGTVKFRVTAITAKSVTVVAEDADIENTFERTLQLKR